MLAEEFHDPTAILVRLTVEVLTRLRIGSYQDIINKRGCYIQQLIQQIIHHQLELQGEIH
jgi:hypothetical protein